MIVAVFKITVFCSWWTLRFFIGKLAMCVKRLLDIVQSVPKISSTVLIVVPHTVVDKKMFPFPFGSIQFKRKPNGNETLSKCSSISKLFQVL